MDKNWVDLPQDLLEKICSLLISPDCITLQSVCKSWRATLKNISSRLRELPWLLMLPKDKEEDPDAFDFFSLSKQKIFTIHLPEMRGKRCCGSFQNGWLMTMDMDLNISLFHPWSKKTLQLPHQYTFIDPWSKRVAHLPHQYQDPNYVDEEGTYTYTYTSEEIQELRDMYITKAALSDDANTVLVIYGFGYSAYCRIGDKVWTRIWVTATMKDVIYHNGQFYALSSETGVYLLHIDDGDNPWFESLTDEEEDLLGPGVVFYLVPDIFTDSMFVIIRSEDFLDAEDGEDENHSRLEFFKTPLGDYVDAEDGDDQNHTRHIRTRFAIYKTPFVKGELSKKKVESLDDRILFLGFNSSMIVRASEFPGFKGNRIYFGDNRMGCYYKSPYRCCDSGVYNVEDRTVDNLFTDRFHPMLLPRFWIATPPYSFQRDSGEKLCME